jgi:YidC/Oxa1 family membrane protein insertase
MMLLLPLVIVAFLFRYPAGLLVYWITTNSWTIVQQYFIRRRIGPAPPKPPKADANGKPSRSLKSVLAGAGVAGTGVADVAGVGAGATGGGATVPPPRSPRKKKKRSGRRR